MPTINFDFDFLTFAVTVVNHIVTGNRKFSALVTLLDLCFAIIRVFSINHLTLNDGFTTGNTATIKYNRGMTNIFQKTIGT